MAFRKIRRMLLAAVVLSLLAGCVTAAGAEELQPVQQMDEKTLTGLLRPFTGEVDYQWGRWQFEETLFNQVILSGNLNDDGYVMYISGEADPEQEGQRDALKETLRQLYESDEETPAIEAAMDAGEETDLDVEIGRLHLEEGMFGLNYNPDTGMAMKADELAQFLTDAGLLEEEFSFFRAVTLGNSDCRARMQTDGTGRLKNLSLFYYGEDAESGKAYFSGMCRELLSGEGLETALQMVESRYDGLETGKNTAEKLGDIRITLNRTKKYYRLVFNIRKITEASAAFSESLEGEKTGSAAAEPVIDPEAFAGIDTDAQAAEQVIFQGNGVTVTFRGLAYGKTGGGVNGIGLRMLVEKEEGVLLDRISFPISDVNRWKDDFRYFDKSMYYPKGAGACSEEITLWWKLEDLKAKIPGFDGISSFRIGVNLIPPEGQGETVRGETTELSTGLPERPLPGITLYSDDTLTLNMTGAEEGNDRRYAVGLLCENRGSDKALLGPYRGRTSVNDFSVYSCWIEMEVPAGMRAKGELLLDRKELQELGITDLEQLETLKMELAQYGESENRIGELLITGETLGLQKRADAAEPAAETVIYESSGVKMSFGGLSADGRSLDLILRNESSEPAVLAVQPLAANGWQLNLRWDFSAKAGANSRQLIPVADYIPDFTELADVRLQVCPCKHNAEYGIQEAQYDLAQEAVLTFGPAAQHDDRGTVLAEQQGVRLIFNGMAEDSEGDLLIKMTVVNESGSAVRWDDSREPNIGTSKAWCALNGIEGEYYVLFNGPNRLEAGLRTETYIRIFRENLEALGLSAGDVKTVDFEWSLFPDAEKIDYVKLNIHAE